MDYVIGRTNGKESLEIKISKCDEHLLKEYKWYKSHYGYAVTAKGLRMHRLIMNAPKGMVVDHINHNKLDNRRENLRICTNAENTRNRKIQGGVRYRKDKKKYEAYLVRNYKHIFLGYYDTYEQALEVRKNAE